MSVSPPSGFTAASYWLWHDATHAFCLLDGLVFYLAAGLQHTPNNQTLFSSHKKGHCGAVINHISTNLPYGIRCHLEKQRQVQVIAYSHRNNHLFSMSSAEWAQLKHRQNAAHF